MRTLGSSALLTIFTSPIATLGRAAAKGSWVGPFAAMVLVAVAANMAVLASVGLGNFVSQAVADSAQAEALAARVEGSAVARSIIYVGAAIFPSALVLGVTVIFVALALIGGLPLTARQILTVVTYTFFVYFTVTGALTALVAWLTENPADFDVARPLASSLGDLVDENASPVLLAFLRSIDPFTALVVALLSTGFCAASPRLRPATSWGMVLGVWGAYAGGRAMLAAF